MIISNNPLISHIKSGQSNQSCLMCYDCGTQSVAPHVSVMGLCPKPVRLRLWGVPLTNHTLNLLTVAQQTNTFVFGL